MSNGFWSFEMCSVTIRKVNYVTVICITSNFNNWPKLDPLSSNSRCWYQMCFMKIVTQYFAHMPDWWSICNSDTLPYSSMPYVQEKPNWTRLVNIFSHWTSQFRVGKLSYCKYIIETLLQFFSSNFAHSFSKFIPKCYPTD